jgi:ribonuclease HII
MKKSIQNINKNIDAALVDGISKIPGIEIYQESIISGDNKCKVIGAASIMAKFIRDFIIKKYDRIFPFYKLSQNAGYGTAEHVKGIKVYGKSFMHRKSFKIKLIDS